MSAKPQVLVIDDEEGHARAAAESLERVGFPCDVATSGGEGLRRIETGVYGIVLTDMVMPDMSGMDVLENIYTHWPATRVVMFTGKGTIETAVEAMQKGATTYLQKPLDIHELRAVVEKLSEEIIKERSRTAPPEFHFEGIVGESPAMIRALEKVRQVAPTDATVLIYGETGTGKELAARALHNGSPRSKHPFVALNCAALSEGIIESELFGHRRGSFTGAVADRTGRVEYADQGTLFLDEVADMPTSTQVKLLRVLEQGEIAPIGTNKTVKVNVRVVAATHRRLGEEVEAGRFRADLYYRLKVVTVQLPALRERKEDIPLLVESFVAEVASRIGRKPPVLSEQVLAALSRYEWPGNVRELKNVIENIVITVPLPALEVEHLPENICRVSSTAVVPARSNLPQTMEEAEILAIRQALLRTGGNREEAANLLGIGERTLYRKIKKYGL